MSSSFERRRKRPLISAFIAHDTGVVKVVVLLSDVVVVFFFFFPQSDDDIEASSSKSLQSSSSPSKKRFRSDAKIGSKNGGKKTSSSSSFLFFLFLLLFLFLFLLSFCFGPIINQAHVFCVSFSVVFLPSSKNIFSPNKNSTIPNPKLRYFSLSQKQLIQCALHSLTLLTAFKLLLWDSRTTTLSHIDLYENAKERDKKTPFFVRHQRYEYYE